MGFITSIVTSIAPIFIATSPITSYADQIHSIHRTRSSTGFSLDIPLIMLLSSILKLFYYPGAHFSTSLLVQAILMIAVHIVLLYVALANRPPPSHLPFQNTAAGKKRPYDFWQWRQTRTLLGRSGILHCGVVGAAHLPQPNPVFETYTTILGAVALTVEATLPIPQLLANYQRRGCKGFRPSVIANWIVGDTFKMWFFFASAKGEVPWAFKACGIFQATCDLGLGLQWFVWRDGVEGVAGGVGEKELRSPPPESAGETFEMLRGGQGYGEKGVGIDLGEGAGGWERRGA